MNEKEIKTLINQLKQQFKSKYKNKSEEEIEHMILDMFFQMFVNDKMDRQDLIALTNSLGYEVNEEMLNEIEKEKKGGK